MKTRTFWSVMTLLIVASMALAACGGFDASQLTVAENPATETAPATEAPALTEAPPPTKAPVDAVISLETVTFSVDHNPDWQCMQNQNTGEKGWKNYNLRNDHPEWKLLQRNACPSYPPDQAYDTNFDLGEKVFLLVDQNPEWQCMVKDGDYRWKNAHHPANKQWSVENDVTLCPGDQPKDKVDSDGDPDETLTAYVPSIPGTSTTTGLTDNSDSANVETFTTDLSTHTAVTISFDLGVADLEALFNPVDHNGMAYGIIGKDAESSGIQVVVTHGSKDKVSNGNAFGLVGQTLAQLAEETSDSNGEESNSCQPSGSTPMCNKGGNFTNGGGNGLTPASWSTTSCNWVCQ